MKRVENEREMRGEGYYTLAGEEFSHRKFGKNISFALCNRNAVEIRESELDVFSREGRFTLIHDVHRNSSIRDVNSNR